MSIIIWLHYVKIKDGYAFFRVLNVLKPLQTLLDTFR